MTMTMIMNVCLLRFCMFTTCFAVVIATMTIIIIRIIMVVIVVVQHLHKEFRGFFLIEKRQEKGNPKA